MVNREAGRGAVLLPVFRGELSGGPVCGGGQTGEHIPEVVERIDAIKIKRF